MSTVINIFKKYGKCIYISKTCKEPSLAKFPPIICNDGLSLSVQAGVNYYCSPQEEIDTFEYDAVEVFKTEELKDDIRMNMFELDKYVYAYVPVELIDLIIEEHKGINYEAIENYIAGLQ